MSLFKAFIDSWNSLKVPRQHSDPAQWPPPQPSLSEHTNIGRNPQTKQQPLETLPSAAVCRYWGTILSFLFLKHTFPSILYAVALKSTRSALHSKGILCAKSKCGLAAVCTKRLSILVEMPCDVLAGHQGQLWVSCTRTPSKACDRTMNPCKQIQCKIHNSCSLYFYLNMSVTSLVYSTWLKT